MANISYSEAILIEKFREKLVDALWDEKDDHKSDLFLIRWLRVIALVDNFYALLTPEMNGVARDLDLTKAEAMLCKFLEWRKENNIENILKITFDDFYTQNYQYFIDGFDKEGRPLVILPAGKWDIAKIVDEGKCAEYACYVNQFFERIVHAIKTCPLNPGNPSPQTQFALIVDFDGFSYTQLARWSVIQTMLGFGQVYEEYYPEILHSAFFINCTWIFTTFFNFLKPILGTKTIDKIRSFGTERNQWETEIFKSIDPDQIKVQLGETIESSNNLSNYSP